MPRSNINTTQTITHRKTKHQCHKNYSSENQFEQERFEINLLFLPSQNGLMIEI